MTVKESKVFQLENKKVVRLWVCVILIDMYVCIFYMWKLVHNRMILDLIKNI